MHVSSDIQTQRALYLILRRMKNHTLNQCHLCHNQGKQAPAWAHFSFGFNTQQEKSGSKLTFLHGFLSYSSRETPVVSFGYFNYSLQENRLYVLSHISLRYITS